MAPVAEITQDNIVVRDGRVVKIEHWVCWNGTDYPTIVIERIGNSFTSKIGDPEHGGGAPRTGALDEVISGLHPKVQAEFHRLFSVENPTEASISEEGFFKYLIITQ